MMSGLWAIVVCLTVVFGFHEAEAGYMYGLGFSPIIQSMRGTGGNYGFGYPYSPYAYNYGNAYQGGGANGANGFYGYGFPYYG
ncbi:hypothetical protein BV898_04640 [Hypsibius exemplaris]|uniref:Uncharacterized protein n=1 Tax=Hypsibius exemplaris TaxID=2072580 RepID=A0A1W0X1U2_HYPEX|nr:hypothetical protein BV898_04640 [Hypsibius exemplaris]